MQNETIDLNEYNKLRQAHERAKTAADQAAGALAQQMRKLETDFGCMTLAEAKTKQAQLQAERETHKQAYETAKAAYIRDYPNA